MPMDANIGPGQSQPHGGTGSQIRSRVTVVCAECKRLKLKCDRRTPCSSCLKRDTVPRCTYSAAAAEKIDVQSLHNRVLILEAQLNQLTSGKLKLSSNDLDHALLAVGSSGSSVLVPLDDVAGLWLEHLDLARDSGIDIQPAVFGMSSELESLERRDPTRSEGSPRSHGDSVHGSPHTNSISTSDPPLSSFPHLLSFPRAVTPALLALLPSAPQRPILLEVLGSVLRMHPSLNFPHFRARIMAMFSEGSGPEEIGIGPSRETEQPTLSFFAAAAAGFALAMQCSPCGVHTSSPHVSHTPPSPTPCSLPSVSSLLALSSHTLDRIEDFMPYDLDFLHALILRCLCMLHDGMPRVSQAVFATVGKMVNVARMMGLARDPDEFSLSAATKYSLWEAEMRRRLWWDVFYYDLFISDCMGFAPLISDDQHTCRMPADVDEDAFLPKSATLPLPAEQQGVSNFSYFVQKCKLAQLVKNMKKRVSEPSSSSTLSTSVTTEPSLDLVSQAESEIQQYLLDLPQAFKLDIDTDPADPGYTSSSSTLPSASAVEMPPPHLIIQRCELVAIAHQLVLKLFHPFLRRSNVRPPDNAMNASINASHAIIHASRVAQGVWQRHGGGGLGRYSSTNNIPSSHGVFYPFARQLFDATVVAAHVVIQAPQSIVAKVALEDVRVALDVLRDPALATGRGRAPSRGGIEGCPSEAVTIVEMMLRKAEMAKRNYMTTTVGIKRKHEEVDDGVAKGFWLPYVGSGVATESPSTGSPVNGHMQVSPRAKLSDKPFAPENLQHRIPASSTSVPRERDKDRKYPAVGIRNRANTGSAPDLHGPGGASRRRDSSVSNPPRPPSDTSNYGRPPSTSEIRSTIATDVLAGSNEFSLTASYGTERHVVDMAVSPTTPRFTSQSQQPQQQHQQQQQQQPLPAPPPESYPAHSFQSPGTSATQNQQQTMYDSGSYVSQTPQQPPPASFFVVQYQPPVPPPPQGFRSMSGHGHSHPHSHSHSHAPPPPPQQQHHVDMMGLLPTQSGGGMDTSDLPRIAKQEEGADGSETQSQAQTQPHPHPGGSSFTSGPEGWNNPAVARFAGQPPWNSGYNY